MEFLRRLGEPVFDRFRSLPMSSRVAGLAFGLVIAAGLWLLAGRTPPAELVPLMDGRELSEPQIARMTSAFRKHHLDDARITDRMIEIPRAAKDAYLMALDEEDAWPAGFDDPVDRALAGTNPLMPWQQSRESLERGEKQMLARIIEEMNGIENAAVQYDETRQTGFPPRVEVRAVVAVKAVGRRPLELEEIEAIRDTVVAFKSGLEREDVTITDLNACRAYPGTRVADTSQAASRALAAAKRTVEDEWRAKIEQRLSMYPRAAVAVNAHFAEQSPGDPLDGGIPSRETHVTRLVHVSASIDLPRSYFVTVWRQRYGAAPDQTPPPEQVDKIEREICGNIERAVAAMLPLPAPGWQSSRPVTVTSHDELQATFDRVPAPADLPVRMGLVAVAVAVFGAVILLAGRHVRRRLRGQTNDPGRTGDRQEDDEPESTVTLLSLRSEPPPTFVELREQLKNAVKRDPDFAAETLKQWLSRAA